MARLHDVRLLCDFHFCQTTPQSTMQRFDDHLNLISLIDEAGPHSGRPGLQLPLVAAVEVVAVVAVPPRHGTLKACPDNHIHCVWILDWGVN